jgi:hypothetical protein
MNNQTVMNPINDEDLKMIHRDNGLQQIMSMLPESLSNFSDERNVDVIGLQQSQMIRTALDNLFDAMISAGLLCASTDNDATKQQIFANILISYGPICNVSDGGGSDA